MNLDFQLKLQAYLDGELPAAEARELERTLAADAPARALLAELRNTSAALAQFEAGAKHPESREFFWSKIQREIARAEKAPAPVRESASFWRRFLIPAGAAASLALAALLALPVVLGGRGGAVSVETLLVDSGAMTYRDDAERMTLVWLSYPAENPVADFYSEDTIQ